MVWCRHKPHVIAALVLLVHVLGASAVDINISVDSKFGVDSATCGRGTGASITPCRTIEAALVQAVGYDRSNDWRCIDERNDFWIRFILTTR